MEKEKLVIIIHIFLILVILGLCFKIYYTSKNFQCERCYISFSSKNIVEENYTVQANISAIELYESLKEDECIIIWDEASGYIGGRGKIENE